VKKAREMLGLYALTKLELWHEDGRTEASAWACMRSIETEVTRLMLNAEDDAAAPSAASVEDVT
jgi:hypothetical protein